MIPWSVRQRLRHSQSSQSDEYLKTCLKEQGRGGAGGCVFVFVCACPSVREGGYLVSPLAFACACVCHMHVHECMYLPIRACVWCL